MRLVKNKEKYWEFIRKLRNDPSVKGGFIEQDDISVEQQVEYMSKYNDSYFICLVGDNPAGYIGSMLQDIRLAVSPEYQRKGVGRFMLKKFMKIRPGAYAKVLLNNEPSKRLFESAGFSWTHSNDKFNYFVKR